MVIIQMIEDDKNANTTESFRGIFVKKKIEKVKH